MAIELFQIKWTKLYSFEKALQQPEAKEGGVYALYRTTGKNKRLHYVGKTKDFSNRFSSHKRGASHMLSDAELKKCFVCFGLIWSFEKSHMSDNIIPTQLQDIESFFINELQPIGCGGSTKKRYTGNYPMIIINIGSVTKPFQKFMCHNPELLKALGKSPKKKTSQTSDPLGF